MTSRFLAFTAVFIFPLATVSVILGLEAHSPADTLTVCASGCDYTAVQAAVSAANNGDVIAMAGETFVENVVVDKSLTLEGAGDDTVIDGDQAGSVISITQGVTVDIHYLTIQNGRSLYGAGVENLGTLLLNGVVISGNTADFDGGGVDNFGGRLTLVNCVITGNVAGQGGGIASDTVLTLTNSLIMDNRATEAGGGLYNFEQAIILDSIFADNRVTGQGSGGGIYNEGTLTLQNGTLNGNSAVYGGGLFNGYILTVEIAHILNNAASEGGGIYNDNTAVLTNTLVMSNTATNRGGGLFNQDVFSLTHSTVATNFASFSGGGVYNDGTFQLVNTTLSGNQAGDGGGIRNGGRVEANNITLAENFAIVGGGLYNLNGILILQNTLLGNSPNSADCFGPVISNGYNLASDESCGFTAVGDLNNTPPLLGPLQYNGGYTPTHAPSPLSPVISAGNPAVPGSDDLACEPTDQRGIPRPLGPACDMGAYETQLLRVYLPVVLR